MRRLLAMLLLIVPLTLAVSACEEGPMEEAGESVDEAVDEAGDAVDD